MRLRSIPSLMFVAGAVGMLLLACGPVAPPPCGPDTCTGCCDGAGVCQVGVTEVACGTGGNTCSACSSPLVCQLGTCVQSGAAPCNGCKDASGKCVEGTSAAACGSGGGQCVTCNANEACNAGTCVSECKSENAACQSGAECCSGQCSLLGFCTRGVGDGGSDGGGEDGGDGDGGTEDGGPGDGGTCGDLCQASPGPLDPACGDPCVAQVCSTDPFCCSNAWDPECVGIAVSVCGLSCNGTDGGPGGFCGDVCSAWPAPMDPTCADPCIGSVCAADPYCCQNAWDSTCAQLSVSICGACGGGFDGGGFDGGGFDGGGFDGGGFDGGSGFCGNVCATWSIPMDATCADPCVGTVCSQDPYCCTNQWDSTCVSEATSMCPGTCGGSDGGIVDAGSDGGSGYCGPVCQVAPVAMDPTCADPCVSTVCGVDPYCCTNQWDSICVDRAAAMCGAACPGFDGGGFDGGWSDAGWSDAGWSDAGWSDAGWSDAGFPWP